ncbi:MAG: DotU family type IV/VI secretion system protein [Desulfovibrio sp.]|nr:DotU family type IV/VI secretion system protein [Desulfovibrio sp.]
MDEHDRFSSLMAFSLHYAESAEGLSMTLEDIAAELARLFEEERGSSFFLDASERTENDEALLDDARFAVAAFADEKMLNAPRPDATGWMPLSLQCRYFSTTEAGIRFFDRLDALLSGFGIEGASERSYSDLPERLERARGHEGRPGFWCLKVFARCLLYGFRGRLFGEEDLLARIRMASSSLLQQHEEPRYSAHLSTPRKKSFRFSLEPFFYVFLPLCVVILFWFYCADILAHIPVDSLETVETEKVAEEGEASLLH